MPRQKSRAKKRGRGRPNGRRSGPTNGSRTLRLWSGSVYRQPIEPTVVVNLHYRTALQTSTGAGVLSVVFGSSPASCINWADENAAWGRYKTLSFAVQFIPYEPYDQSLGTVNAPAFFVRDDRSSTALNATTAYSKQVLKPFGVYKAAGYEAKMVLNDPLQNQWTVVGAPTDYWWIKFYSDGLALTTAYGYFVLHYTVAFSNSE